MNDLVIFGSKYRDLVRLIDAINRVRPTWRLRGFIDDRPQASGGSVFGHPVLGDRSLLPGFAASGIQVFNNVSGVVADARHVAELLQSAGCEVPNLVHPAVDLGYSTLGRGCLLPEGCVVGSGTSIGNYLAARLHVVISHDVVIEDHVFCGPGTVIGSEAHVESGAFIGAGVIVMPGRRIGANCIVGAGTVVSRDVPPHVTVAGPRKGMQRVGGRT